MMGPALSARMSQERRGKARLERLAESERRNGVSRETVEAHAEELEALRRRVAKLEKEGQDLVEADAVDGGYGQPGD